MWRYLARLGRRSRCLTRSPQGPRDAVKLFVYAWNHAWNRPQRYRRQHPTYAAQVFPFAYP